MPTLIDNPRHARSRRCLAISLLCLNATRRRGRYACLVLMALLVVPVGGLRAQGAPATSREQATNEEILKEMRDLRTTVRELQESVLRQQKQIDLLTQHGRSGKDTDPAAPEAPPAKPKHGHGEDDHHAASDFQLTLPDKIQLNLDDGHHLDVSVVLDFTFLRTDDRRADDRSKFDLRELEVGFQGWLTDKVRVDLFLTKPSDEEFEIEEGYFTLRLPHQFMVKAGKYRLDFGKLNTTHETARPFVDLPLPLLNFLGEEQLNDSGVTVGRLIPNPWGHEIGLSITASSADNDVSFNARSSSDPLLSARLYDLMPLGSSSDLEIGLNMATGANDERGGDRTTLALFDLTYRYRPDYATGYDYPARFMWQTEAIINARQGDTGTTNSFGIYSLLDYQFRPAWHAGLRYDYSQFPDSTRSDQSVSAILTWFYSRHSKFRLQYQYLDPATGRRDHRVWLQAVLILGDHQHRRLLGQGD